MALVRASLPLGIVVRKSPGVTRWAPWAWKVVAVLPGAGPARWRELRREADAVDYHAGTLELVLFSTDTESYRVTLAARRPGIAVVLRDNADPGSDKPFEPVLVTASAFEGQDYMDSGDGLIELVPMPDPAMQRPPAAAAPRPRRNSPTREELLEVLREAGSVRAAVSSRSWG